MSARLLPCLLLLGCLALAGPAPAATPRHDAAATVLLRRSVLTAVAATPVGEILRGIEGSLVFLSSEAPPRRSPPPTETRPPAGAGSMPPASAGSNGTPIPSPPPGMSRLSAHSPVLHGAGVDGVSATLVGGVVLAPPGVPDRVQGVINAANTIAGRPYLWGGGHGSWYSSGYDCSGAVSFALAGGGFLAGPLASGQFMAWDAPGPGRWITIYASPSHAYAVIAGFRWDTVGDANGSGPRWHRAGVPPASFVARHPAGY
jgi:cell wall-associated NlpC family hydrolase